MELVILHVLSYGAIYPPKLLIFIACIKFFMWHSLNMVLHDSH